MGIADGGKLLKNIVNMVVNLFPLILIHFSPGQKGGMGGMGFILGFISE